MPTSTQRAEPGSATVKAAILDSAARLFAERGFSATGIRDIAADAGVNPAIVIRHFGSKEELFVRTVRLPESWVRAMNGPIDHIGEQFVRFLADARGSTRGQGAFAALTRASDRPEIRRSLQDSTRTAFVDPIVARLDVPDAALRAHLFAAQLMGLMNAIWVTEDPAILAMDVEDVVRLYAPALQGILTPPGHITTTLTREA